MLWELLTRKNVNRRFINSDELKGYKTIIQMTNAHLQGCEPGGNIRTSRGHMFRDVISNYSLRRDARGEWKKRSDGSDKDTGRSDKMAAAAGKLYYDLECLDGLSTLSRLQAAARQRKLGMS